MKIDLTQIILAVIALAGTIITVYIIPYLKAKIENENSQLTESQRALLQAAIKTGVFAAEQLYKSDQGQQKKHYVLSLLEAQGYAIDSAAVDAAIEAEVKALRLEIAKDA